MIVALLLAGMVVGSVLYTQIVAKELRREMFIRDAYLKRMIDRRGDE